MLVNRDSRSVVTGVSLETTATGGLTQSISGLTKLSVDLPSQSGDKQQVETYAGVVTRKTTLFDPSSSRWEDSTSDQGPSQNDPFICGAGYLAHLPHRVHLLHAVHHLTLTLKPTPFSQPAVYSRANPMVSAAQTQYLCSSYLSLAVTFLETYVSTTFPTWAQI